MIDQEPIDESWVNLGKFVGKTLLSLESGMFLSIGCTLFLVSIYGPGPVFLSDDVILLDGRFLHANGIATVIATIAGI